MLYGKNQARFRLLLNKERLTSNPPYPNTPLRNPIPPRGNHYPRPDAAAARLFDLDGVRCPAASNSIIATLSRQFPGRETPLASQVEAGGEDYRTLHLFSGLTLNCLLDLHHPDCALKEQASFHAHNAWVFF